ncbi:putative DnaJ domain, Chaperone J-domain superfamily [Helianthus annuus]|nr:putative DnaJ domain, Chaperone J-domain superfamily [Helianthus annuus]KAJ0881173.1 putative DnaJ domain, Chaperone J-domain superfamily [Helianthus annuus]KAJ0885203.1 putative DnaJ domain, Chaperone J-domain superfamily [Helianthus annuus]
MDVNGGKSNDFYEILGLKKECTEAELKNAYRKLAMRWHPDRCSASGNSKNVEEANKKFQAVQEAYSVLSDANRRLLYDVGIHDGDDDDDDKDGMADFLSEMATMMRQNKTNENIETSFEELKDLFEEMFESDIKSVDSFSGTKSFTTCPTMFPSYDENISSTNKRGSSGMSTTTVEDHSTFKSSVQGFCLGTNNMEATKRTGCARERRGAKHGSKHKTSRNRISNRD